MTDQEDDIPYGYNLRVTIVYDSVQVTGHGFDALKALGIDINEWWMSGFNGTIEIKGEL